MHPSILQTYVPKVTDEVEAIQITEANMVEVAEWCGGEVGTWWPNGNKPCILVSVTNLEGGPYAAYPGDYVVRRGNGDLKVITEGYFLRFWTAKTR